MIFVTDAHLPEGQFLYEEQTVYRGKSLKFQVVVWMPTFSIKEG